VAKIMDDIFNEWNEEDSPIGPRGGSIAPTSTIYYLFQRSQVWLKNRGQWFEIFAKHWSADIQILERTKGTPQFLIALESFYKRFDEFATFVNNIIGFLKGIAPDILDPVIQVLEQAIEFYFWVREQFPIVPKEPGK
jgi:hypothetical protein